MCTKIKSWNWEAIEAAAEVVAALATILTVFIAFITIREANRDADMTRNQQLTMFKETGKQQSTRFQGVVMSACMQEYFQIRSEAARDWRSQSTSPGERQEVQDLYSERMFGLHFEEYHLFRQDGIPTHVYRVWIKSLKNEMEHPKEYYPQLKIENYITQDTNEDFNIFIQQILRAKSDREIEDLVKREAEKPPYE